MDCDVAAPGGLAGLPGVLDARSTKANEDYIKRANVIIEKQKAKGIDAITGKPVTEAAAEAAKTGKALFIIAEQLKKPTPPPPKED